MNETTLFLSQMIGPIMIILALGFVFNTPFYKQVYSKLEKEPMSFMLAAISSLAIGFSIVIKHNLWETAPEIIISIIGWLSIVKGIGLILIPKHPAFIGKKIIGSGFYWVAAVFWFAIGAYLTWFGYFA